MTWDTFANYTHALTRALGSGVYGTADSSGDSSQSGSIRVKEVLAPPQANQVATLFTQASTDTPWHREPATCHYPIHGDVAAADTSYASSSAACATTTGWNC